MGAAYPYRHRRTRPNRAAEAETTRSNASIPVVIALAAIALYFARDWVLLPALFGFFLLSAGASFLSARINPLSTGYYLTRKPSWAAVGVVFLGSFGLFYATYALWLRHAGPLVPHF